MSKIDERVKALRQKMAEAKIDVYVVPTADFHHSEYVGEHFKAREFITGFTGSAGIAVITQEEAGLWTDGRYFIQATAQLKDGPVMLRKMGEPGVPTIKEYLMDTLKEGQNLGFDGRVIAVGEGEAYEKIVAKKKGGIIYNRDLVGEIWEDRPAMSTEPVFLLGIEYTGESTAEKLTRIREEMAKAGANVHILTSLEDICWTLNMRGDDVAFSPLVLSYAIITEEKMLLYIDEKKLGDEIIEMFAADGIEIRPYNSIYEDVKGLSEQDVVLLDGGRLNYALYQNIPADVKKINAVNPEIWMKGIKNPVEIANVRKAQIKDSVAHVRFMKWLKENVGKMPMTEISCSDKLDEFRAELEGFIRPSFDPISAYGPNGAMCHYKATEESNAEVKEGGFLLTDTGAGFWEGSTDITRTYALGDVPIQQKKDFTVVAISNLALANAKFLYGCTGVILDMLARKPFWDRNLNFNHGTGHGVGYLLNIHEGPAGFRWRSRSGEDAVLEEGMIITDEPGLYIEGSHGIRLENEVLVRKSIANEYGQFMYLEPLTYIPFDLDAIVPEMMSEEDKRHLNEYHAKVYVMISEYLTEEERRWLAEYTRPI